MPNEIAGPLSASIGSSPDYMAIDGTVGDHIKTHDGLKTESSFNCWHSLCNCGVVSILEPGVGPMCVVILAGREKMEDWELN